MHGKNTQKQKNANSSYANKENNTWLSRNNLLFNLRISLFHQDILGTMSARVRWKKGGGAPFGYLFMVIKSVCLECLWFVITLMF